MSFTSMKTVHLFILGLYCFLYTSCQKEFDAPPPENNQPDIESNTLIADLKAMFKGVPLRLETDIIIEGVVIADDRSGNFYKSLVIQDQTAGILLLLDVIGLYNQFPIGRKVYIKCKDLYLGEFNGLIQLGGGENNGSLTRLMEPLLGQHLIKGPLNTPINAIPLRITDVSQAYQNMLVSFNEVEFESPSQTYADALNRISKNITIQDCNGAKMIVRNSGYALFADAITPANNGKITGVLGFFRSDFQLAIRDTTDIEFHNPRCGGGGTGQSIQPIQYVRNLFTGSPIPSISVPVAIKAVVISDRVNGNETSRNVVVQDETGGIVIRFNANHSFNVHTELEILLTGVELSTFNGLLQLNNVPLSNVKVVGNKTMPPLSVDISDILDNIDALESRLIKVTGATITGGSVFSGNRTLQDRTGNISLFTSSTASFKDSPLPTGPVNVTGIVSIFNSPQIKIRNLNDIQP
jgi:hypothetical protein